MATKLKNKKATKTAVSKTAGLVPKETKLQAAKRRYRELREKFNQYAADVRSRKEVQAFHALQTVNGKPGMLDVGSLVSGVTTANLLGKEAYLRAVIDEKDGIGNRVEVIFVDKLPVVPYIYDIY